MEIRLQISDGAYQRMMAHGGRVQGTIGLVNPQEGNFNEHMRRDGLDRIHPSGSRPGQRRREKSATHAHHRP